MANELEIIAPSGSVVYALLRSPSALIWNGTAFEAWNLSHYANYAISLTSIGGQDGTEYTGSFPTAITTAGVYSVEFYVQAGAAPSESADAMLSWSIIEWPGSASTTTVLTQAGLVSLAYCKEYCNVTVSTYDSYLTNRIAAASGAVQKWCRRNFWLQQYVENIDGPGSTTLLLSQYPIQSITQVIAYQYNNNPTTIPGSAFWIKTDGTIGIAPNQQYNGWFGYGDQAFQATYIAGFPEIPDDIQEAVAMIVYQQYLLLGQDVTMDAERIGDYNYKRKGLPYLPADAMNLLSPYRQNIV